MGYGRGIMQKTFSFLAAFCVSCMVFPFAGLTQPAEPAVHSALPPPVLGQPHWRTFTSEEGRFSALLPSTPISRNRLLPASQITLHEFLCRDGAALYAVIYADLPADETQHLSAEEILTIGDNAMLKLTSSTLISKSRLALGGYPGHAMITNRHNGQERLRHTYLAGARLFTLDVVQPLGQAQSADADKFFKSFALLPAKLPSGNR